jgi:hypothetical protein
MSIWDKGLKTIRKQIGETVVYKGTGDLNEEIKGVFSNVAGMRDLLTHTKIIDQEPHLLVRLSDLSQEPSQDDIFVIRSLQWVVAYLEKDGEGGAKIILRESMS